MEPLLEERRALIESKEYVFITVVADLFIFFYLFLVDARFMWIGVPLLIIVSFGILKVAKSRISLFNDRVEKRFFYTGDTDSLHLHEISRIEIEEYAPLGLDFFKQRVLVIYRHIPLVLRLPVSNPEEWKAAIEARLAAFKDK